MPRNWKDPNYKPKPPVNAIKPLRERLLAKIDDSGGPTECWPWTGGTKTDGRAIIYDPPRRSAGATPLVYEMYNKEKLPAGKRVTRSCETRNCMNPIHWVVDTTGNRKAPRSGQEHWATKLTEAQVVEIKARLRDGRETHTQIGADYGVTSGAISSIVKGTAWREVA